MSTLLFYYAAMIAGYYFASRLRDLRDKFSDLDKIFNSLIVFLVLIMGIRMGSDPKVIANLGMIGVYSFIMTLVIVFFSVLFVYLARKALRLDKKGDIASKRKLEKTLKRAANKEKQKGKKLGIIGSKIKNVDIFRPVPERIAIDGGTYGNEGQAKNNNLFITVLVMVPLIIGLIIGYKIILPSDFNSDFINNLTGRLLVMGVTLLLLAIGFSLGLSGNILSSIKKIGIKFLIFPVSAILGSIVGGALCGLVLPVTIPEGMAIGTGFGWYTMAPTVITEAGHTYAGAISFMHNVIREMGGIVLIPFFAGRIGYIEATAVPGVCAMDIAMPIIEKCTKQEMVAYSFGMGLSMSIVVPLLVPIFINI